MPWNFLSFLKGGSVAIKSTISESIPRRIGKLSDSKGVRFLKFGIWMLTLQSVFVA